MKALHPFVAGVALACLPLTSHAFLFDAEVGAAGWSSSPSGWAAGGGEQLDVENDLGLDREVTGFVWAAFEPVLLPNVKLRYTPMSFSDTGNVSHSFDFDGTHFDASRDVETDITLDQLDATVYFQPLDNIVQLGLGLNVKLIEGDIHIRERGNPSHSSKADFSAPIPMLYAHAGVTLPFTGLSAKVEAAGVSYDDNRIIDATASLRYNVLPLVNVEAGYRLQELRAELDDIDVDMQIDGPYLSLVASF